MARARNRSQEYGLTDLRQRSVAPMLSVWGLLTLACGSGLPVLPASPALAQSLPTDLQPTSASEIQAQVSAWTYIPDRGRLEVSTQGTVRPTLFILQDPPRVVVDFPNTRFLADPQELSYDTGRVQTLRISQQTETTTRFVLGLDPSDTLTLNQLQLQTATPERWAVQFTAATDLLSLSPPPELPSTPSETLPAPSSPPPPPNAAATPIPPLLTPQTAPTPVSVQTAAPSADPSSPTPIPLLTPPPRPTPAGPTPIPRYTPLVRPATPVPRLTPPSQTASPPPTPAPLTTPVPPVAQPTSAPRLISPPLPSEIGAPVQILGIQTLEQGFLVQTSGPISASIRRIQSPERVVVDLLNSTLSPGFAERTVPVSQDGVIRLRAGQFEPTISRVVLDVDSTSGDWETVYDPQQGGMRILPAGGKQASLLPQTPSDYSGPLATIQAVQLVGDQLTITADGFLFYRSGWDPDSGSYQISVTPARLPATLADPGLPPNGPVERIRFVQAAPQTVNIFVQPAREFNVIEEAPGQGTRRIALQLQPLDGSLPTAPTVPTSAPGIPQPGILIALDAGHGGRDPGAVGVNGVQEKIVNLDIAQKVEQLLLAAGYQVVMTRIDDREILLQPRVDTAVQAGASIMVSIHTNALDRSGVSGIETYYLRPDSTRLAEIMHRAIVGGTGAIDRGVRRARFFMVRETPTTMPSVLLELGYLTNPAEGSKLATPEYRTQVAQAVAQGIRAYFEGP